MASIIFLNGTSSVGKSTLAREIQRQATVPFWHVASDQFVETGMLPITSRCNIRHKFNNQIKAQHEVIVIHFLIVVTPDLFSSLIP